MVILKEGGMILFLRILLLLILFSFDLSTIASAEAPLTAAFIRDHQLWIKKGNQEIIDMCIIRNGHMTVGLLVILMVMRREKNRIYSFMIQGKRKLSTLCKGHNI
jgi:hypothetical protein